MKEIFTKKLLVILSVVSGIVLTAIILAVTTGNTYFPALSNPDDVFYQRVDDSGNVLYKITYDDLYEEIKGNNGIQQLLLMVDNNILEDYINSVTNDEVQDKITELKYGSNDSEYLANLSAADKTDLEATYNQSMVLAGFQDNPEDYAKLMVAREKFVLDSIKNENMISDKEIVTEFLNNYFEDIDAVKIRFTSEADANDVMHKFNLLTISTTGFREYNGYIFDNELIRDNSDNVADAYKTVDTYYFNEDGNIVDTNDVVVYELFGNNIYVDTDGNQYRISPEQSNLNDLVNGLGDTIIDDSLLFNNLDDAVAYKDNHTEYFTVTKTDPFDENEDAVVKDSSGAVAYTIHNDGSIFDTNNDDVTYSTDLIVNKHFVPIKDVTLVTTSNSTELTDDEVLEKYIEMYNYVYGDYRDTLPTNSTADDIIASGSDYFTFNYNNLHTTNSQIADYMFKTLSIADNSRYSKEPVELTTGKSTSFYLIYKLSESAKEDVLDLMFSSVEADLLVPTTIGQTVLFPTESYYDSTISWNSSNSDVLSKSGVVVTPDEDTVVELTYTITLFGNSRTNTINVTVLANGDTVIPTDTVQGAIEYSDMISDEAVYNQVKDKLYNDYVYGTDSDRNVGNTLSSERAKLGFTVNDYYMALDYKGIYSDYVFDGHGDKTVLASLDKTLNSDNPMIITADDFLEFTLTKNPSLYLLYAAQDNELLNSEYFTQLFGDQKDLLKNKSAKMDDMLNQISQSKQYYQYLQKVYAQYGMTFTYDSFTDYIYSQFQVKSEHELLQYFVSASIQPFFINETLKDLDIINALDPEVEEYYDNYFSLNVTHILVSVDFDEDGSPDNLNTYIDTLDPAGVTALNQTKNDLFTLIDEYQGSFDELVAEYNNASRDDATWGAFKQQGFFISTEDLNSVDKDGNSHSLTYSGEYGVKDKFVPEFTSALKDLYDEYTIPQNLDKDEMYSNSLIQSKFGFHYIKVTKGDDFDKPTFKFTEEDSNNPKYTVGLENDNDSPSISQLEIYAKYKFYSTAYDLSDPDVEETYGIDVPKIPNDLKKAFDTYFDNLLSSTYVIGIINVNLVDKLASGEFVGTDYTTYSNADLKAMLNEVGNVYFEAILGDYYN